MNIVKNIWTTYGGRAIGVAAGWIVGHFVAAPLAAKGIAVTPEQQAQMQQALAGAVDVTVGVLATYVGAHRVASKRINPGDAASGTVAQEEKSLKRVLLEQARATAAEADQRLGGE